MKYDTAHMILSFLSAGAMFFISGCVSYQAYKNRGQISFPFVVEIDQQSLSFVKSDLYRKAFRLKAFTYAYLILGFSLIGVILLIHLKSAMVAAIVNAAVIGAIEAQVKKVVKEINLAK